MSDADSTTAINSSNIGFQLLKKCGWTEGTGLGVSEQGRLQPLEVHVKSNKRGLGAEQKTRKILPIRDKPSSKEQNVKEQSQSSKKAKALSRRVRKVLEHEKLLQEREFERAFRREFWPEDV